jgi:acyl-coenzyme A synthetase/AMP-(fatty) acid ligase
MSGRAFAPLSCDQPLERLHQCLSALRPKVIVSALKDHTLRQTHELFGLKVLSPGFTSVGHRLPKQPAEPDPKQLIYVLFTSGSTGAPKGVMADHSNIANTMMWSMDMLDWRPDDVIGCAANFFFDIAMFDVFTAFYFDLCLAVFAKPSEPPHLADEVAAFHVSSIFSAPVLFSQLLRSGLLRDTRMSTLRRIVSGGDFFPPSHIIGWKEALPKVEVFNVWGPTETSIVNTMHRVTHLDLPALQQGKYPPVGKAHPRMPFVLIDESKNVLQGPNQRGVICMLGPCVTRGYLGDMEGTRQVYIELNGQAAYLTQDLGYVDESGNLYILGRVGSTVKVAGYRIDLAEVESAAVRLPEIDLAGAFVHEREPGIQELWLGIEPRLKQGTVDIFAIKQGLRKILPVYMVPKRILVFDNLPKTPNGKIDRRAIQDAAVALGSMHP